MPFAIGFFGIQIGLLQVALANEGTAARKPVLGIVFPYMPVFDEMPFCNFP